MAPADAPLRVRAFARAVAVAPYAFWVWPIYILGFPLLFLIMARKNNYPDNYLLLFLFTVTMAYMVGYCCTAIGVDRPWLVYEAFLITGAVFCALTLFTIQTKIKLEAYGGVLLICLISLITVSYIQLFLFPEAEVLSTALLWIGVVLFSVYIMYDVSMICERLGYDDYIVAALELYLDIINLFLRILSLLGGRRD